MTPTAFYSNLFIIGMKKPSRASVA